MNTSCFDGLNIPSYLAYSTFVVITNRDFYGLGRNQRTKISDIFSSWRDINHGVPQISILGPLLLNIHINDLFMFSDDFRIANFADDCFPYEFGGTTDEIIYKLKVDSLTLIQWYRSNYLKPHPDK